MKINKRTVFRYLIDMSDTINLFIEERFNLNPKKKVLEKQQNMISVKQLEETIGKNLLKKE